ncbi:MAG: sensor histidine kinase [Armatimonadetes bacterium]|nr:sensor histidine kinase [Armatimonadota bacterium]
MGSLLQNLRKRWHEEQAGEGFLNPIYFWVGVRWITWIISLGIILAAAAPPENLQNGPLLLTLTGVQLLVMTLYLPVVRPRYRPILERTGLIRWCEDNPVLAATDIGFSLVVVYFSGGWNSPFYEFALTSVLAPSLKYGLRGATLASFGFSAAYLAVVSAAGPGVESFYEDGRLVGGLISAPINPFMVAYFSAFLSELMNRLSQEKARVRQLAAQEERNRLARDMHDGVAQTLFMLTLSLEACAEIAGRQGSEKLKTRLEGLVGVSRQALWEIRNSMYDLGPLLEEGPLSQTLDRLFREFQTVSQIPVEVSYSGDEPVLSKEQRVGVYRILQESLANACKHSRACRVRVELGFGPDRVRLVVEDDGQGFEPASVSRGRGLGNLASRAHELGGELEIRSHPGEGTRIELVLNPMPLN